MVGVEFEIPLQLGRRRAGLREASARLSEARSEAEGRVDEARFELLRAHQEVQRARELRAAGVPEAGFSPAEG